jgi:hypothetical protein
LPFKIAKKHIESSNATTSDIINLVIKKQKVSITQEELNILVQLPGVSFNLPLNKETKKVFDELIKVNLNKERGLPGVYI